MKLQYPLVGEWPISTSYGEILLDADGVPYPHNAIDYGCPSGTSVLAAHSGIMSYEKTPLGGIVARVTGDECYTRYCHLLGYWVANGNKVQAGDKIAVSGNTGSATTGAHLHYASSWLDDTPFNPLDYVGGSMSKVALHFQQMTSWAKDVVSQYWQYPRWVKVMNPPVPDAFPGTFVLGRLFVKPDNNAWEQAMVAKGTVGGAEYFNAMMPYYSERRGMVTAWEAVNEPPLQTEKQAADYRDFLAEWSRLMHSVGLKCCGGSIGVGNPAVTKYNSSRDVLKAIGPSLARCDYWSYHGYWQRPYDPADDWWAHRYRLIVSDCAAMGITLPPLIISECGADIGGGHNDGWRVQYNGDWNAYFADIKRYSAELAKDSYVESAMFFTSGPNGDWDMFDVDQVNAIALGQFVVGDVPVPVDDLLTWAETIVIPFNPNAALCKYILGKSWTPQSPEVMHNGIAYMWGWHDNQRTLCAWKDGHVVEIITRPN